MRSGEEYSEGHRKMIRVKKCDTYRIWLKISADAGAAGAFGGPTSIIKSHHNVGGLPEKMNLKLIEPLQMLFKDEVRKLGIELGLNMKIWSGVSHFRALALQYG